MSAEKTDAQAAWQKARAMKAEALEGMPRRLGCPRNLQLGTYYR